jgi:hypothetical protein
VLTELGSDTEALECPDLAHAALERGAQTADAMSQVGESNLPDLLPRLARIAEENFGPEYRVEKVPFGIQFAEPVTPQPDELTATGTVRWTFAGVTVSGDTDE